MAFKFVILCAAFALAQNASGAILPSAASGASASSSSSSTSSSGSGISSTSTSTSSTSSSSAASGYGNTLALPAGNLILGNGLAGYGSGIVSGCGSNLALAPANLAGYNSGIASAYGSGLALAPANLAGYGISAGPLGFSNNLINLPNYILGQQGVALNTWSGSPVYDIPCGITIASQSQMGGSVAVAGTTPFAGSCWFEGAVPSEGVAAVSYNAGNGAALYDAGCGVGLGGSNGVVIQSTQNSGYPSFANYCI